MKWPPWKKDRMRAAADEGRLAREEAERKLAEAHPVMESMRRLRKVNHVDERIRTLIERRVAQEKREGHEPHASAG